jgi:hypothetical protein
LLKITQVEEEWHTAIRVATHNQDVWHLGTALSPSFDRFFLKNELSSLRSKGFSQQSLSLCPTLSAIDVCLRFLFRFLRYIDCSLRPLFGNLFLLNCLRELWGEG